MYKNKFELDHRLKCRIIMYLDENIKEHMFHVRT